MAQSPDYWCRVDRDFRRGVTAYSGAALDASARVSGR
jgi:hypothetical protein